MNAHFKDSDWAQRELLSACPLFSGLPSELFGELIEASQVLRLPANRDIFLAGEPIRAAHILLSGSAKRWTTTAGRRATNLIELVDAQQVLSLGELFGMPQYAATCTTITACVVVMIDLRKLRHIIRHDADFSGRLLQALAQRQCAIEFDVTGCNAGLTGTQRVLDYLLDLAADRAALAGETTVTLKPSKKMIAARIGMTPESFSRSLRELSESGVIFVEGSTVHIQNAALLDTESGDSTQRLYFSRKPRAAAPQPRNHLSSGSLINTCGRLRVLSQRMAIAWALVASEVDQVKGRSKLRQLDIEFGRNLRRIAKAVSVSGLDELLGAIGEIWARYQQALLAEPMTPDHAAEVLALSEEILEATDRLTRRAVASDAGTGARYVNIAGRNRMLSQRIGKFFMFRDWAGCSVLISHYSSPSCAEFENNLNELQHSGKNLPEMTAQLKEVSTQWQKYIRSLIPDIAHPGKPQHTKLVLAEGERLLRLVDTIVKLYERLSN